MLRRFSCFCLTLALVLSLNCCSQNNVDDRDAQFASGPDLTLYFLDVGQGDSILLCTPNGNTMLIDAGQPNGAGVVEDALYSLGISKLDVVVASHPHSDHIGGMAQVIQDFSVGSVYMPKAAHTSQTYELLLETIQSKGLKINTAKAGIEIPLDPTITVKILSPVKEKYDELNNYSAVIKITYGENSFLLMGDAEKPVEDELLRSKQDVSADLIKIGHHGSDTSTSPTFLDAVHPTDAVISVGEGNSYGHPNQSVLSSLEERGITVHRTDLDGTIVVSSNGNQLSFREFYPQQAPNAPPEYTQPQQDPETGGGTDDIIVYITETGQKYHRETCSSLKKSKIPIERSEAVRQGYEPCSICKPDNP